MKNTATLFFAALLSLCGCTGARFDGAALEASDKNNGIIRIEAVSDSIIHISAAKSKLPKNESLCVIPYQKRGNVNFSKGKGASILSTDALTVTLDHKNLTVTVADKEGNILLQEERRSFERITAGDDEGWSVAEVFTSPDDEAFYGLGQHQSDEFNYKGKNETLYQYNTKVSVPFVVSSRGYGLLWDNYSLTRWGDSRDYAQLNEVFEEEGFLATYTAADGSEIKRNEHFIDYSDLDKVHNFPEEFMDKFYGAKIVWEGDVKAKESGIHKMILYYAGYTSVEVDGRTVVPEHWRTAWNPNSVKFDLEMEAGKTRHIRITWRPDGGVSYLSLKALSPVDPAEQGKMKWWSEMGDGIDYYFVYGGNADKVISGYRQLTGKSQIMPKWAMGYWQSCERYKTSDELLTAVKEHRDRHIGLDNIVLDWFSWREDDWGSQEFDPERFPDPKGMVDSVHAMDARIMMSVWPKFYATTGHFKEFVDIDAMYMQAVEDSVRDWVGPGYIGSFYDAYNPEARKLFWGQMSEHLLPLGIDAWWMDASEPDILSNSSLEYRKKLSGPNYLGSSTRYLNAYALVNAMAIYDGQRGERPDQRVFLLTRSGFAGLQRYSTATWSGDIGTCWEDMKAQISAGLNFASSGIPYWTMDIGGFSAQSKFQNAAEGSEEMEEWRELNARWHQWGAFAPLYRAHGQYPLREPYNIAPESHPAYKSILASNRLRYELMPYIYTLASRTWFDDYTIMRPLMMDFASDKKVLNISDQFMFGEAFMICPVYNYRQRSREVYLPEGQWYDFHSGALLDGGCKIVASAPYEYSPIYVKAGSVIPMGSAIETTADRNPELTVVVYSGADGAFILYEDDGISYRYERGEFSCIPFIWNNDESTLKIGMRIGDYEGMAKERRINVKLVTATGTKTSSIDYTGAEASIKF